MKLQITMRALCAMQQELSRYDDVETGGVLLGDFADGILTIREATDGGYQNVIREKNTFQYDHDYVSHVASILSELYTPPLALIGVWHKHNRCGGEDPFSHADEKMHLQLQNTALQPAISILFEKAESGVYDMRAFLLDVSGNHKEIEPEVIE